MHKSFDTNQYISNYTLLQRSCTTAGFRRDFRSAKQVGRAVIVFFFFFSLDTRRENRAYLDIGARCITETDSVRPLTRENERHEKLEKPERECHVSMVTRQLRLPGLTGSISSRLFFPDSHVNVLYIFSS